MPSFLKHFNVNWVNGMKVSKDHFIQQDKSNDDKIRDAAGLRLNHLNYGLIPELPGEKYGTEQLVIKIDNQNLLRADLKILRAVTADGCRIEITDNAKLEELSLKLTNELGNLGKEEKEYYVLLSVNPFNRVASGEIDPSETPPRYPDSLPEYSISILETSQQANNTLNPRALVIGKITLGNEKCSVSEDYIPPCMTLRSHRKLMVFHSNVEKFFNQLELDLVSILRKINDKKQDTSLAQSVKELSVNLLQYISMLNVRMKWELQDQPPVEILGSIAVFARIIRNTIDSNSSAGKEELLNYFTNRSDLKQGDFEKLLVYCINFDYSHVEIQTSLEQFGEFVQIMNSLFTKLESLAYIGKKKETSIFVKEDKPKRSFLAD